MGLQNRTFWILECFTPRSSSFQQEHGKNQENIQKIIEKLFKERKQEKELGMSSK